MKKIMVIVAATAMTLTAGAASAGGWGQSGSQNYSHGLINVSPSLGLGNVKVLNGTSILNGSPIGSGNVVSGILNGNRTNVGNGILGGSRLGIFGGKSKPRGRRSRRW